MNIKQLLIEKERVAYIQNNPALADFFDATLRYVLMLEEQVNEKDRIIEEFQEKLDPSGNG